MASSTVARSRQPQNTVESEDALALRAAELAAWARRNARVIIAVAVVALVLVGGYVFWRMNEARQEARAAAAFLALRDNPSVVTAAGSAQLDAFIRTHEGTVEAAEARLMLAEVRLRENQPQRAVEVLRPLAEGGSPLAAQARMMIGSAHAQAGDHAAAVQAYTQAAEQATLDYQVFEALGQAAIVHEQQGNWQEAAAVYERLLERVDEGSQQESVVQMRLTEARIRAGQA